MYIDKTGWYEFIKPVAATTHIAYVYEDGSLYLPESGVTEDDFILASASPTPSVWRLVREDQE